MIISASYRTDIPAFYSDWFLERLRVGTAQVTNPYGGQIHEVPLTRAAVDGFVFWTRNAGPFRSALAEVAERGFPFVVQYTVTGYPHALETSVIAPERSVEQIANLAQTYGPRAVVWRYDPLLFTSLTPPAWHRRNFARLAELLVGHTDEVVLSCAQIYRKTKANLDRAATRHGFTWLDPDADQKRSLLGELAEIAGRRKLKARLCAQPDLLCPGLKPARCIDAQRLSDLAKQPLRARDKGNRPGCLCAESRDIGAYDSCPHGCTYCYAVRRPDAAKQNHRRHEPTAPLLVPAQTAKVSI